jgi:hypothetical protein
MTYIAKYITDSCSRNIIFMLNDMFIDDKYIFYVGQNKYFNIKYCHSNGYVRLLTTDNTLLIINNPYLGGSEYNYKYDNICDYYTSDGPGYDYKCYKDNPYQAVFTYDKREINRFPCHVILSNGTILYNNNVFKYIFHYMGYSDNKHKRNNYFKMLKKGLCIANFINGQYVNYMSPHLPRSIITYKQWLTNNNIKLVMNLILCLIKIFKVPRPIFEIIMTDAGMSWCTEWYRKEFRNVYYEEYLDHLKQYANDNGFVYVY